VTSTGAQGGLQVHRSRSREFALQALYQHIVGGNEMTPSTCSRATWRLSQGRSAHYDALLHGCIETAADLDALITPKLDRRWKISPIEHACMWIGVYEFQHCPDVPWRVVLNECIELAKEFGGTDGHKYVNACSTAWPPAAPHRSGRRQGPERRRQAGAGPQGRTRSRPARPGQPGLIFCQAAFPPERCLFLCSAAPPPLEEPMQHPRATH
jgi:N utilization substance protein B